jgi:hypothetical protein
MTTTNTTVMFMATARAIGTNLQLFPQLAPAAVATTMNTDRHPTRGP